MLYFLKTSIKIIKNPNPNCNPNEKCDVLPYMAMSRDIT